MNKKKEDEKYMSYIDALMLTGFKSAKLRDLISSDKIVVVEKNPKRRWQISRSDIDDIVNLQNEYTGVCKYLEETFEKHRFNYNLKECRVQLYSFFEINGWFGLSVIKKDEAWFLAKATEEYYVKREEISSIDSKVFQSWLLAYKKTPMEKIDILAQNFCEKFPKTVMYYIEFLNKNNGSSVKAALYLLDYLADEVCKELYLYNDKEISALEKGLSDEKDDMLKIYLHDFLEFLAQNHSVSYIFTYKRKRSGKGKKTYSPYTLKAFCLMEYIVLGETVWIERDLVNKACEKVKFAEMWFFVAIHFFSSWREKDIKALKFPKSTLTREMIVSKMAAGHVDEFERIATDFVHINNDFYPRHPSKGRNNSHNMNLQLFVPKSYRKPFGIILSILIYHRNQQNEREFGENRKEESKYIFTKVEYEQFFGKTFLKATSNRIFSSTRMNKTYMKIIEREANKDIEFGGNREKGYVAAAILRAHYYSNPYKLPEVTDVYLNGKLDTKDDIEFFVKMLFERGVCSFYPMIILEEYLGTDFKNLPEKNKTEIVKSFGLSYYKVEELAVKSESLTLSCIERARALLKANIQSEDDSYNVLKNISLGMAKDKSSNMCLMTALDKCCPYPERIGCLGCPFEIYTDIAERSLTELLESTRLAWDMANSKDEKERYRKIIESAIIPALNEIQYCKHVAEVSYNSNVILLNEHKETENVGDNG